MFSGFGGGNTTSAFGGTGNVGEPPGTAQVPFQPFQEKEQNSNQTNSFQNILFQEPYKKFSAEELRMVDYAQGRRFGTGAAGPAGAFGTTSGFGGTSTGFGANNTTTANTGFGTSTGGGGLFGNTQQQQQSTGFGANTATTGTSGFGSGGGGLFGGANKPGGLFGGTTTTTTQPAQTGGLFGSNTGGTGFGATNNNTGFGANTNTASNNLFGNNQQQNKPFGGFGSTATTSTPFGQNTGATTGAFGAANTATNTGGGLFGNTAAQNTNTGGGLFGSNPQQQQSTLGGGFGSSPFGGQNNTQQTGGGLFGQQANQQPQQQQGGGLFGQKPATGGTGLFGSTANTSSPFGQQNNQQQQGGGLFGQKPAATGGGLFGQNAGQQQTQGGTGLFSNLGSNQNQQQQTGGGLFGNLGNNQQKPSLFGGSAQPSTGLFGQQPQQQQGTGLFGGSTAQQPQQQSILGNSLFNSANQGIPQSLTASINDVNAYGTPSLFAGLGATEVQNPGPLATPLSAKNKPPRKNSILPMWKLNPSSGSKFVTPSKRGYGFSYSTYGSPVTPSTANSTPGGFSQSLVGAGNMNRSMSKSFSSTSLRRSINSEDTILSPGSFSSSMGPGSRGSGRFNKLTVDRSLRVDLFSPVAKDKQVIDAPDGPRKLAKRVSFDTRNVDAESSASIGRSPEEDLGYIRPTNGSSSSVNGSAPRAVDDTPEMEQVRGNELAIVHEEASPTPAAAVSASPAGDNGPGNYWMRPSKEEILNMNRVQRAQVANFTVGRDNVGQVRFKVPVDLTSIDIDEIFNKIVLLETRSCTVYPVAEKKPLVGKGLNVPAEISLQHSWPRAKDKKTKLPAKSGRQFEKHVERLKSIPDTTFIDYDADQGVWTFSVEHFTTYGLDYDDEDTDGETLGEIVTEEAALLTSQRKLARDENENSPSTDAEDTFEFRRKRRALPGAFDHTGAVSDDEEEEQSFLSNRSAGSTSHALVQHDGEEMDVEHALPEDQDASSCLGYHQAAEPEFDSPFQGSMAEYQQETPGGIMRARMRALKVSITPLKLQVADGDDWTEMLQKTISPYKRDRAALKTINEEETYESLKESVRHEVSPAKPTTVPDGRGFATSIDLMNSLFEKPKSPVRTTERVTIPTSGFKVGSTPVF